VSRCKDREAVLAGLRSGDASSRGRLEALVGVEPCIAAGLERCVAAEDWEAFELYVLAASRHPDPSMTRTLCEVLDRQLDNISSEDIVSVLDVVADPAAVDSLERALWWEPPWDEFRHLAIKCVWALSAIGTEAASDILRDAATTAPERVREAALEALAASKSGPAD